MLLSSTSDHDYPQPPSTCFSSFSLLRWHSHKHTHQRFSSRDICHATPTCINSSLMAANNHYRSTVWWIHLNTTDREKLHTAALSRNNWSRFQPLAGLILHWAEKSPIDPRSPPPTPPQHRKSTFYRDSIHIPPQTQSHDHTTTWFVRPNVDPSDMSLIEKTLWSRRVSWCVINAIAIRIGAKWMNDCGSSTNPLFFSVT